MIGRHVYFGHAFTRTPKLCVQALTPKSERADPRRFIRNRVVLCAEATVSAPDPRHEWPVYPIADCWPSDDAEDAQDPGIACRWTRIRTRLHRFSSSTCSRRSGRGLPKQVAPTRSDTIRSDAHPKDTIPAAADELAVQFPLTRVFTPARDTCADVSAGLSPTMPVDAIVDFTKTLFHHSISEPRTFVMAMSYQPGTTPFRLRVAQILRWMTSELFVGSLSCSRRVCARHCTSAVCPHCGSGITAPRCFA